MSKVKSRKWTSSEEAKLLEHCKNGLNYEAVSQLIDRSEGATAIRHGLIGAKMVNEGRDFKEVVKEIGIMSEDLERAINYENKKLQNAKNGKNGKSKTSPAQELSDISDRIKKIAESMA